MVKLNNVTNMKAGTPQAHRFFELRDHATARMLGAEKDVEESAEAQAFRELLSKYNIAQ